MVPSTHLTLTLVVGSSMMLLVACKSSKIQDHLGLRIDRRQQTGKFAPIHFAAHLGGVCGLVAGGMLP